MRTRYILSAICLCGASCATVQRTDNASSLTVAVPVPVVIDRTNNSFTLVPTIVLKNSTQAPLGIIRSGSELSNVRTEFDVFDPAGAKLKALRTKPLYFPGGGRVATKWVQPGETWTWESHEAEIYVSSGTGDYRIVARLYVDADEFDSRPFTFRVEGAPNKAPLRTSGGVTPDAGAPVAPPPGAAGL